MVLFSPPTDPIVPATEATTRPGVAALFSRYALAPRGRNIYKLSDGTYTEVQPFNDAGVVHTYFGGHVEDVSPEEADALLAAGYDVYEVDMWQAVWRWLTRGGTTDPTERPPGAR